MTRYAGGPPARGQSELGHAARACTELPVRHAGCGARPAARVAHCQAKGAVLPSLRNSAERCFLLNNTSTKSPVRQQCSRCNRCLSKCCHSSAAYIPWAGLAQVQLCADAAITSLATFRVRGSRPCKQGRPKRMPRVDRWQSVLRRGRAGGHARPPAGVRHARALPRGGRQHQCACASVSAPERGVARCARCRASGLPDRAC